MTGFVLQGHTSYKGRKCWKQLSVHNTERTVWSLIVLDAGHQRSEVRDRRTEDSRTPRETESGSSADELMVDSWTSDWRKAARGTWDTSVGLAELMSESIFSASLLQASICTGSTSHHKQAITFLADRFDIYSQVWGTSGAYDASLGKTPPSRALVHWLCFRSKQRYKTSYLIQANHVEKTKPALHVFTKHFY